MSYQLLKYFVEFRQGRVKIKKMLSPYVAALHILGLLYGVAILKTKILAGL